MQTFSSWLAKVLHEQTRDVNLILRDETALHFLIAWSLFESKCFEGFLKAKYLASFCDTVVAEGFAPLKIARQLEHFHARYRDRRKLKNLLHDDKTPRDVKAEFERCLSMETSSLSARDRVFTVVFVIYRFRNNMFHGNKRVGSWLGFREQITHCTEAMQAFVSHSEQIRPTMHIAVAA